MQAQLDALLNRLPASDVEPPRAFVNGLAELQTFAQGLEQRCKRLQDEAAAARRHAHLTCLKLSLHVPHASWEMGAAIYAALAVENAAKTDLRAW